MPSCLNLSLSPQFGDPANCQNTECINAVAPSYTACDFDVVARECKSKLGADSQIIVFLLPSVCDAVGELTVDNIACVVNVSITRGGEFPEACPDLNEATLLDGSNVSLQLVANYELF